MKSTSPSDPEPVPPGSSGDDEERAAGFVLFRESEGRRLYLVLRHRNGGHWSFPKGRIESNEDAPTAARREVIEETGLATLRAIDGFRTQSAYRIVRHGTTIDKTVVYYLAAVDGAAEVRLSNEHSGGEWLTPEAAQDRLTYEESRRILREAEAYLGA